MTSLTDRIRTFDPGLQRFAPRDASSRTVPEVGARAAPEASPTRSDLDAETLEVVEKFEAAFSELAPPAPTPSPRHDPADATHPDFGFLDEELRKAFADREPSAEPPPRGVVHRARDPDVAVTPRPPQREESAQDPSIDDAMATLRASEARGKAAGAGARAKKAESSPVIEWQPEASRTHQSMSEIEPEISPVEPLAANDSWAARSRKEWPKIAGAAAVALIVGTAVGYLAGKTPSAGGSRATIATTPQGGALLRFDYDLTRR